MTEVRKYKTKPVVIEAMEWDGTAEGATPIIDWVLANGGTARYHSLNLSRDNKLLPESLVIATLEGDMHAAPGWHIVKGLLGEFYPCAPEALKAKYDFINDRGDLVPPYDR